MAGEVIDFRELLLREESRAPEQPRAGGATVRKALACDLGPLTRIHARAFPRSFLTSLGPSLVRGFYGCFLRGPEHFGLAAERRGRLAGFAFATRDPAALYREFYGANLWPLALAVARRALADRAAAAHVLGHWRHALPALRSLLPGGASQAARPSPEARLLSIGVSPSELRSGIGRLLVTELRRALTEAGVRTVGLTVLRENAAALTFYRSLGFLVERQTSSSLQLTASTDAPNQGGCHG